MAAIGDHPGSRLDEPPPWGIVRNPKDQDSNGMNGRSSPLGTRRLARGAILSAAAVGIIGIAAVGAVIALGVLAAGALAHATVRLARRAAGRTGSPDPVIDGEFRVIREGERSAARQLRRLPQA